MCNDDAIASIECNQLIEKKKPTNSGLMSSQIRPTYTKMNTQTIAAVTAS